MLDPELKSRLENQIEQSGYPLELDVVDQLRESEYLVTPNLSFSTSEQAIREIDAVAFSDVGRREEWPFGAVGDVLAVECKQIDDKPWIFLEEVFDPGAAIGLGQKMEIITDLSYANNMGPLAGCMNTALRGHHFNSHLPTARTYFEAFSGPFANWKPFSTVA